ncbi:hypothetical protein [Leptolinea tardivitalis]|uniref:hypothetical protein n=1 Tax=Leptolinea tardivitalis TaxID=229920 RepID=UPI000781C4DB|nr:hypothetical protein [Leptolinea tardivitalis]GAP22012.1 hypothetical protein LTAR_02230 [Leptolinea tardivitalis]
MKQNRALTVLIPILILAAVASTCAGLFSQGGPGPFTVTSLHGKDVTLYGQGIYRFDTYFRAPIARGTDAVTLFLAVPLLVFTFIQYQKGSLRGTLFLTGLLAYFLYNSASMALGIAYNSFFLVYIIYFSCSLYSFILAYFSIRVDELPERIEAGFPHRLAAYLLFFAGLSVFVWLNEILNPLFKGIYPPGLDTYTTEITFVIDLGIIPAACYIAGFLLLRRRPNGYLLTFVMLTLLAMIGLVVLSQTVFQAAAGIYLAPGQYFGLVGTFTILGCLAIWTIVKILKNVAN